MSGVVVRETAAESSDHTPMALSARPSGVGHFDGMLISLGPRACLRLPACFCRWRKRRVQSDTTVPPLFQALQRALSVLRQESADTCSCRWFCGACQTMLRWAFGSRVIFAQQRRGTRRARK